MYLGSSRGLERTLVPRDGIPTYLFPMAAPTSPRGVFLLVVATIRALFVVRRLRPRVTLATGGYVSVPGGIASWLLRVPLVLFLPDVIPGKAVRLLLPLASQIAVTSEDAARRLPTSKTVITGYPLRSDFLGATREAGRHRFGVPGRERVVFVFGGSLGSRAINQAVAAHLVELLSVAQVIHVCGEARLDEAEGVRRSLEGTLRGRYHLFPYLHGEDMALAMAAADLVVARSGASIMAEAPALGVPCVLVPLPNPRVHQRENAQMMASRGAAIVLQDDGLTESLVPAVLELLSDAAHLARMAEASRALARPDAADRIAALLAGVA